MARILLIHSSLKYQYLRISIEMKKINLTIATLLAGMGLLSSAHASILAGSSTGVNVTTLNVVADSRDEDNADYYWSDSNGEAFGGDSASFTVDGTGGSTIEAADYFDEYTDSNGYSVSSIYGELISYGSILFSVNYCDPSDPVAGCLNIFSQDDSIDASWFDGTLGSASEQGVLYDSNNGAGHWLQVGDTGYVAFAYDESISTNGSYGVAEYCEDGPCGDGLSLGSYAVDWTSDSIQYGWLEVTHGSVHVNRMGLQPSAVPEPGSIFLFAIGALGVFGVQRRKKMLVANQ